MKIPFLDLHRQYLAIQPKIEQVIRDVFQEMQFLNGKFTTAFEQNFAQYIGANHCVACANGTDALEIALQTLGIGTGDEVLLPAVSWASTAQAVSNRGATPVFVDVEPVFFCLNPTLLATKITARTKAILPVHLYGNPADMLFIQTIAQKHGLKIIEDAAQAHGTTLHSKKVGTFGDVAAFSFYPTKNLGAYGDAGAMLFQEEGLAQKARMLRQNGQQVKNLHLSEGRNSRIDELQAAILKVKLSYLEDWNRERKKMAEIYRQNLRNIDAITLPQTRPEAKHVWHLFTIQTPFRKALQQFLAENHIQTQIHYPTALPFLPMYAAFHTQQEEFPVAFLHSQTTLSLPFFIGITPQEIVYISAKISEFFQKKAVSLPKT